MKRNLILILLSIYISSASAQKQIYVFSYFNNNGKDGLHLAYSKDGLKWKALKNDNSFLQPVLSKDSLMRDPCIITGNDGLFHMVWTVSWKSKGIGYASSKDLINWSPQKYIPVMEQEEGAKNCWAPEITWDDKEKQYMIYWSTAIKGRFIDPNPINRSSNRIYYTTTKDFLNFAPTKLLYDPGFAAIDATIVKDGNRWVMFFKDEREKPTQKNIKIAFADNITGPYSKASEPISPKSDIIPVEGPTSLKKNNEWVVYYDKYFSQAYGAIKSNDLIHWTDISATISLPLGIRHGSIFTVKKDVLKKLLKL